MSLALGLRRALPAVRLVGLTVLCAALLGGASEAILRQRAVQAALPFPDIGSSYEQGAKQMQMEWLQAKKPVDCFFVGSSVVVQGIDPAIVQADLAQAGGPSLSCYNAGIRGESMQSLEQKVAQLSQYHPRLIVYGVTFRDLLGRPPRPGNPRATMEVIPNFDTAPNPAAPPKPFALAPWLRGNSYVYRYYSTFRWYMGASTPEMDNRAQYEAGLDARGFLHITSAWPDVNRVPYPRVIFNTNKVKLSSMARAIGPHGEQTTIVVVEMPIPPASTHLLMDDDQAYAIYIQAAQKVADAQGVPFIHTMPLKAIPDNGWADPIHLNETGAQAFSHWLAAALRGVLSQ